jgi:7,8-dihydropterin-6-yl-methyl-4-(beta-D-ribofuranosyl)aminobenzene 5'-phosphate synthase
MDKLLVLCDRKTNYSYMHTDLGFSVFIKYGGFNILFDTGSKPGILEWNSEICGVNLNDIDYIFISHNHWDHIGGSLYFIDKHIETNL